MEFAGKVALITGAAAHIGKAIAETLARNGATVVLTDWNEQKLAETADAIRSFGGKVVSYACDVSDEVRVNSIVADVLEKQGKIDILINNAGIWRDNWGAFAESSSSTWKKKIDVNILGTLYFTRAVLPSMIEHKYGRIIDLASVAGVYGNANMADYSMTKGAIISFTRALAKEVAASGITVNAVSPGNVQEDEGGDNLKLSHIPRSGTPQENADLVAFLASDHAAYISGQNILIDGCRKSM